MAAATELFELRQSLTDALRNINGVPLAASRGFLSDYATDLRAVHDAYAAFMAVAMQDFSDSLHESRLVSAETYAGYLSDAKSDCLPDSETVEVSEYDARRERSYEPA